MMNKKPLLTLILVSALVAIVVVVVLKILGQSNPTVVAGGVAGGIAGALSTTVFRRKKVTNNKTGV